MHSYSNYRDTCRIPNSLIVFLFTYRHEALVMISGGSGITPFISIIRDFIYRSMQQNCKVPKVVLVAAFKSASDISNLDLLLPGSCTSIDIAQIQLEIDAYITREKEQPTSGEAHKHLQTTTIWFKPSPEDLPISAAIGPNSWLWLCAIISTSFVMFLLFLAIVTRYWIYPTEKRGEIYHYSSKSLWDMFLVCACIFVATSVIFLFQKRRNSFSERTQIQNVELRTPTASSAGSWLCGGGGTNTDRELESLPCQPLVEVTRVHFGSRPDLKSKLLF